MQHRFLSANTVMDSRSCTRISHWGSIVQNQTITNNKLHRFQNLFISIALHSFIARWREYLLLHETGTSKPCNHFDQRLFWEYAFSGLLGSLSVGEEPLICCMSYILVEFGWFLSIIERNRCSTGQKLRVHLYMSVEGFRCYNLGTSEDS